MHAIEPSQSPSNGFARHRLDPMSLIADLHTVSPRAESPPPAPDDRESEPLLRPVARALRRYWRSVVLVAVLATGSALGLSLLQHKQYTSTAVVLLQNPTLDSGLFGSTPPANSEDPARLTATDVQLLPLSSVTSLAASHFAGLTGAAVSSELSVKSDSQSDILRITVTDPIPQRSARLANAVAQAFISLRRDSDRSSILAAKAQLQAQYAALPPAARNSATGRDLVARADQLALYAGVQTGNADLVQPAQAPSAPSSPHPLQNAALGLILGLLVGLVVVSLRDRFDRRIRDPKELESLFRRPVLGEVPLLRDDQDRRIALEAVRFIRTNLTFFSIDRDVRTILITSAEPADGKTTLAWELAAAAASHSDRCLLLECDLRRPAISRRLGLGSGHGLAHVLLGLADLDSTVATVRAPGLVGEAGRFVDVLPAGAVPPNPSDLIASPRMAEVLRQVRARYDLVVLDASPLALVVDAAPLAKLADGVIVVSRLNKSRRHTSERLRGQLDNMHAAFIGVVANCVPPSRDTYASGYTDGAPAQIFAPSAPDGDKGP